MDFGGYGGGGYGRKRGYDDMGMGMHSDGSSYQYGGGGYGGGGYGGGGYGGGGYGGQTSRDRIRDQQVRRQ